MKKFSTFVLASVLASTLFSQTVIAQEEEMATPSPEEQFLTLDSDANGTVSEDESAADEGLASVFTEVDSDGNGEVSQEEYLAYFASSAY